MVKYSTCSINKVEQVLYFPISHSNEHRLHSIEWSSYRVDFYLLPQYFTTTTDYPTCIYTLCTCLVLLLYYIVNSIYIIINNKPFKYLNIDQDTKGLSSICNHHKCLIP